VLHSRPVERRAPAALGVLRELKVEALTGHPALDVADPAPGVAPGAESPEHWQIRFYTRSFQRDEEAMWPWARGIIFLPHLPQALREHRRSKTLPAGRIRRPRRIDAEAECPTAEAGSHVISRLSSG
jgi:hypothetical protein